MNNKGYNLRKKYFIYRLKHYEINVNLLKQGEVFKLQHVIALYM